MTDIEIARNTKLEPITKIAEEVGIKEEEIESYGKYKAKINQKTINRLKDKKDGKLILVTAMSPTPLGEGKTTISIAIADGLNKLNKNAVLALREPSLGPVFGLKGGATGGGKVQVAPMEDINLHFTGDIHAITSANNLLSAMIDNHIYFGNELKIKKVTWKRCLDLNDRQLRKINTGLSGESKIVPREDGFDISVATEIMAILCLSKDLKDLKQRIGNIIIGYNEDGKPVFARDLKAEGALTVLLKDAINPNLVQTLEHTPCLIHGGPFANIAHGCNSIRATNLALKLGDYVITEAGFGSDLGAEKFIDIKCRQTGLKPDAVVCVATIKAIKYHGGALKEDIQKEDINALQKGMGNLYTHIENIKNVYGLNVVVALNKYGTDTEKEIQYVKKEVKNRGFDFSVVDGWAKGGDGAIDIAEKIVNLTADNKINTDYQTSIEQDIEGEARKYIGTGAGENTKIDVKENTLNFAYDLNQNIQDKILNVAKKIYGAEGVEYSSEALENIEKIENMGYGKLPICIAKTQYSLSDNPKNLLCDEPYTITVRDVALKSGAGFIVVLAGEIMTMPGLPKVPVAENIDIGENGETVGIF